jgi:hypothetical protein
MSKLNSEIFPTILSATLGGVLLVGTSLSQSGQASPKPMGDLPNNFLISLQFKAPGDPAPINSVGGGSRGAVKFALPGDAAPVNSVGGGSRGNIRFGLPGDAAPVNSVGGGSRGNIRFQSPGDPTPINTIGAGTRSDEQPLLTALLPTTNYGRTIAAHPTFFVYIPPTATKEVFFSLKDENGKHHYQTMLKISGRGGIVSITLPNNAPELEIDKNYQWFFAPIPPGGILQPDNYGVTGWVKRVAAPNFTQANSSENPVAKATEYAEAGIWYDTVAVLVSAQLAQPSNETLLSEWKDLLKEVGLDGIANQPIAEQL